MRSTFVRHLAVYLGLAADTEERSQDGDSDAAVAALSTAQILLRSAFLGLGVGTVWAVLWAMTDEGPTGIGTSVARGVFVSGVMLVVALVVGVRARSAARQQVVPRRLGRTKPLVASPGVIGLPPVVV